MSLSVNQSIFTKLCQIEMWIEKAANEHILSKLNSTTPSLTFTHNQTYVHDVQV